MIEAKFFPKDVVSLVVPTRNGDRFRAVFFGKTRTFEVTAMHLGFWFARLVEDE